MTSNQAGLGLEMVVHRLTLSFHAEGGQVEQVGLVLDKDEEQLLARVLKGMIFLMSHSRKCL